MRHESYRRVIELIAAKEPLRTGLDLDAATDILLTLIGDGIYPAFRRDRRWAHERCVECLCSAVPELLSLSHDGVRYPNLDSDGAWSPIYRSGLYVALRSSALKYARSDQLACVRLRYPMAARWP